MNLPTWFVQTSDGALHGYYSRDILLIHLTANKGEAVTILEIVPDLMVVYRPVTEESLRARVA